MKPTETPKLAKSDCESEQNILSDLRQFTGTTHWYRTIIPRIVYTDGAKHLADRCGAYWLLDDIALHQAEKSVKDEEFQVWIIRVDVSQGKGVLSCEDGNKP